MALIDAKQPLRIGRPQRPGRHGDPVADREQGSDGKEEQHHLGYRRVQFLDAVPFVAGGPAARDRIAVVHLHGLSSWSMIERFALSNRIRFPGQNAYIEATPKRAIR